MLSRVEYFNSLLAGVTYEQTALLQKIENRSARLIFRQKKQNKSRKNVMAMSHISWRYNTGFLLQKALSVFKLATFYIVPYFDGTLPQYLSCCLSSYSPSRSLRSSSLKFQLITLVNMKHARARFFQYQAPSVWNSLPLKVSTKKISSLLVFSQML